jgi:hypothetical protein
MSLDSDSSVSTGWAGEWLMESHEWLIIVVVRCLCILYMSDTFSLILLTIVSDLHYYRPRKLNSWSSNFKCVIIYIFSL